MRNGSLFKMPVYTLLINCFSDTEIYVFGSIESRYEYTKKTICEFLEDNNYMDPDHEDQWLQKSDKWKTVQDIRNDLENLEIHFSIDLYEQPFLL